ncbi:uncharacterized protein [Amphiura filiformis]|uniref:uncharacterized protein n=1 Tax=Amphiura filiformis TaxID=82378 RepID=UPI003B21AC0D
MKKTLIVMVVGIYTLVCTSANQSENEDCIALCNQCVEVSDTLTHMGCNKHCEKLKQKDDGKLSCPNLIAPIKGSPALEDEIEAFNARASELCENGDYSTMVEELYTDDCVVVFNGQAPGFGKEDMKRAWIEFFENVPSYNRAVFTTTAFGENNGNSWADGVADFYQNDVLAFSWRYMFLFKRVNGALLLFMDIDF